MQIEGNVFIVTGGASGLGEGTAHRLLAAGGKVVVVDRDERLGAEVSAALGKGCVFVAANVSDPAGAERAIAAAGTLGALRGLINCAGIGFGERVVGKNGPHSLETFLKVIDVNLTGSFNMGRLVAHAMSTLPATPSGERGVIIFTASLAAFEGQIGQAAYSASKAGLVGLTLPMARDLARFGIRVNTIAPGLFKTPLAKNITPEALQALVDSTLFPKRLGRPDEFAALAQHIIENEILNGETIRADGAVRLAPK